MRFPSDLTLIIFNLTGVLSWSNTGKFTIFSAGSVKDLTTTWPFIPCADEITPTIINYYYKLTVNMACI